MALAQYITRRSGHRNPGSHNAFTVLGNPHVAACLGDENIWHSFAHLESSTAGTAAFRHGLGRADFNPCSAGQGSGDAKQDHMFKDITLCPTRVQRLRLTQANSTVRIRSQRCGPSKCITHTQVTTQALRCNRTSHGPKHEAMKNAKYVRKEVFACDSV